MSRLARRPRYADVVGTLALVVAMSGTAYAAASLPRDSVGARQVKDNAIRSAEIKNGQVGSAELAVGSVGTAQLQDNNATGADIADGSLSLADLVGTDIIGDVTLTVSANTCGPLLLTVVGIKPGESALLTFRGASTADLMFGPLQVTAADQATVRVCNISAGPFSGTIPVRIISFG